MKPAGGVWVVEGKRVLRDYLGVELTRYQHSKYGTRVVLGRVEGPLCYAGLLFATECESNKGLPHCLEHLCFTETKHFPRGLMDLLATRSGSNGLNAFTEDDHTEYELEVVGEEGLTRVLPVFMKHVLTPNLTPEAFTTEIFHVNGKGENQGVVYSEMVGRCNTESDLMWNKCAKVTFGPNSPYAYESGGLPDELAKLTREDIINYHKSVYATKNLSIIVLGQFSHAELLDVVDKALEEAVEDGASIEVVRKQFTQRLTAPEEESTQASVCFPADDTSVGSFLYSAKVPWDIRDTEKTTAMSVLFRYLSNLSSAPLNQAFVELENPIASSVSCDVHNTCDPYFVMLFSGVPFNAKANAHLDTAVSSTRETTEEEETGDEEGEEEEDGEEEEEEGKKTEPASPPAKENWYEDNAMLKKLVSVLQTTAEKLEKEADEYRMLQAALHKERISNKEDFEDSPHETLNYGIIPELIFEQYPGLDGRVPHIPFGKFLDESEAFEALDDKDAAWWSSLLRTVVIQPLQQTAATGKGATEVRTVPSVGLSKQLEKKVERDTKANVKQYGPAGLKKLQKIVDAAEVRVRPNVPPEMRAAFPPPVQLQAIQDFPHKVEDRTELAGGVETFDVEVLSSFLEARVYFDVNGLPLETKRALYLFHELLMESDVEGTNYRQVVQQLDEAFVSSFTSLGKSSGFMSVEYLPTCISLGFSCEPQKSDSVALWVRKLLRGVEFTKEKVVSTCKTLLVDLTEHMRSGRSVLDFASAFATFAPDSHTLLMSPFSQKAYLKRALKNMDETLNTLAVIKEFLQRGTTPAAVFVGGTDAGVRHKIEADVAAALGKRPRIFRGMRWGYGTAEKRVVVPSRAFAIGVGGVDGTYITVEAPITVTPHAAKEYLSLRLLCECINLSEGELAMSIRGRGLAYGAGVHVQGYKGSISLDIWDCTNASKALQGALEVLRSIQEDEDCEILSEFNVKNAVGVLVYSLMSHRGTPTDVLGSTITAAARQYFSPAEFREAHQVLHDITKEDLMESYRRHLLPMLYTADPEAAAEHPPPDPQSFRVVAGVVSDQRSVQKVKKVLETQLGITVAAHGNLSTLYETADNLINKHTKAASSSD